VRGWPWRAVQRQAGAATTAPAASPASAAAPGVTHWPPLSAEQGHGHDGPHTHDGPCTTARLGPWSGVCDASSHPPPSLPPGRACHVCHSHVYLPPRCPRNLSRSHSCPARTSRTVLPSPAATGTFLWSGGRVPCGAAHRAKRAPQPQAPMVQGESLLTRICAGPRPLQRVFSCSPARTRRWDR
jgi:hypothetical protein